MGGIKRYWLNDKTNLMLLRGKKMCFALWFAKSGSVENVLFA